MTDNDLLQEIHRVREKVARECNYDVHMIGERMRQREREEMARGVRYVPPPQSAVVREGAPKVRKQASPGQRPGNPGEKTNTP